MRPVPGTSPAHFRTGFTRVELLVVVAIVAFAVRPAVAYIAVPADRLTLPEVMLEFPSVVVLELDKADPKRGAYLFKVAEVLQGNPPKEPVRHVLFPDGKVPERFAGLKPGSRIVTFIGSPDNRTLSFAAGAWYITQPDQGWERFNQFRDDFAALYAGSADGLADACRTLARGGAATVRVAPKDVPADARVFVRYDAAFPHRRTPVADPDAKPRPAADLRGAMKDKNPAIRREALFGLPATDIVASLTDPHPEVRLAGVALLVDRKGDPAVDVPALVKTLSDEDRFVCSFAARALSARGDAARPAVKALVAALADRNYDHDFRPHRAAEAAEAILKLTKDEKPVHEALALLTSNRMLNDERIDSEGTRTAAARALGRCGSVAAPALGELVKRLKDPLPATRLAAAEAVLRIGGTDTQRAAAATVLAAGLTDGTPGTRAQAARAVGETVRTELAPALRKLADDPAAEVREAAAEALRRLGAK